MYKLILLVLAALLAVSTAQYYGYPAVGFRSAYGVYGGYARPYAYSAGYTPYAYYG